MPYTNSEKYERELAGMARGDCWNLAGTIYNNQWVCAARPLNLSTLQIGKLMHCFQVAAQIRN